MTVSRGRVVKGPGAGERVPVRPGRAAHGVRGRVEHKIAVDAEDRASRIVARAETEAAAIVAAAERAAAEVRLRAEAEARADGAAAVADRAIRLASIESRIDERALDRLVSIARILAERLIGEELTLAPERLASLARQALAEARGAKSVVIVANPADADVLERSLPAVGVDPAAVRVRRDPGRLQGSLRLETEVGSLDADIAPQLERLALRLRDSMKHAE